MTSAQFDKSVINAAESFGNNSNVKYNVFPNCDLTGNCNTSTSTILNKSGLGQGAIQNIESQIPGINTGFGDIKPWTKAEQTNAVEQTKPKTKNPNRIESVGDSKRKTNR